MTVPGLFIGALILVIAQLWLPKKQAFLPLLIAACHFGFGEIFGDITVARLILVAGLSRALLSGDFSKRASSKLDITILLFCLWMIISSAGHNLQPLNPWTYRIGMAFNIYCTFIYAKIYLPDREAFMRFVSYLPIVLLPLALGMFIEQKTQNNYYYLIGGRSSYSGMREGKVRAQGPFTTPILAGCAGATALPFAYLLWKTNRRKRAVFAFATFMSITLSSSSSGPLAAVGITGLAIVLWRWREHLTSLRWVVLCLGLLYWVTKGRGPWHLMSSMDLVGGSTGYFRARLIDQGMTYFSEWWFIGTDYTRHWMDTGVSFSTDHTDMTNYFLHLGVIGGLPLVIGLIVILALCFKMLGRRMKFLRSVHHPDEIVLWCTGAAITAHTISFVSISYFDQIYVLFYLLIGAVPGLAQTTGATVTATASFANSPDGEFKEKASNTSQLAKNVIPQIA